MKRPIFIIGAILLLSQVALASTGFEDGNSYKLARITGKVHVTCDYESGSGWADQDCKREKLLPTFATRFHVDGVTAATRLELTVQHEDGSVANAEASMNQRTGMSDSDFNLWVGSGRYDEALLDAGSNLVKFKLMLRDGRVERQGEFSVVVDISSPREYTCRPGRMASDNSQDCYSNPPHYLCDQYFRYENYCGAGSIFE